MPALENCRMRISLAASVGLITAAAAAAAPVQADSVDDTFTSVLNAMGAENQDSGGAAALGQSICPKLAKPGGTFASVASSITGHDGMSPAMADMFTRIAILMYCPSMMTSLANGDMPKLPHLPGVSRH